MKTDILHPNAGTTVRTLTALLALAGVSLLSGCGSTIGGDTAGVGVGGTGTGSGGSTGTILYVMAAKAAEPASVTLSGTVVDSYLDSTLVFIDKNGNYRHDAPEEPSAVTGQNGAYTLQVEPADVGQYPLVARPVRASSIDSDNVPDSCLLSLAKEGVHGGTTGNTISPITTLLHTMLETGSYASLPDAAAALKVRLGLPATTDLLADNIATDNDPVALAVRQAAREMLNCVDPVR